MKVKSERKSNRELGEFGAHRKAVELLDSVVADIAPLASRLGLGKPVAQQLASADSVAANIEEGFGRGSKKDYAHFLVMARGSAQETIAAPSVWLIGCHPLRWQSTNLSAKKSSPS